MDENVTDNSSDSSHAASAWSHRWLVVGIGMALAAYAVCAGYGIPQHLAALVVEGLAADHGAAGHHASYVAVQPPPYWMIGPFAGLLGAIAVLPLVPRVSHWWESNLHRLLVAGALGAVTLGYYLFVHDGPVKAHWPMPRVVEASAHGPNLRLAAAVLADALLAEYVPFIVLLFTLYTISGGIRIEGDLAAHPATNLLFLACGALAASFIGTTGAAMLLIRPLLETNRERRHVTHTVVFFIFIVCNCGGCLLPIGDPPLFLGYLLGVPFLWTLQLWPEWLVVNGALLALYYGMDRWWFYPHETVRDVARDEVEVRGLKFVGLWPNAVLLLGVVLSVGLLDPTKPLPGTQWHPWVYLREAVQLGLVALSLLLGDDAVRRRSGFNYHAILEVAALFLGIFVCMQAPLQILRIEGASLGLHTPAQFFWATGSLSAVLDNAPTYVVFFETARSLAVGSAGPLVGGVPEPLLRGVSLGAVFMGAMTYIGNGPNFMVRAVAEKAGVRMPSFFGYLFYSVTILLPLFAVVVWLFL